MIEIHSDITAIQPDLILSLQPKYTQEKKTQIIFGRT